MGTKKTITVGRQFGSGGLAVAKALGEKLGLPVYDGELIEEAARESGIGAGHFSRNDEKRNYWNFGGGISDAQLFTLQSEAIRNLAAKGPAIFVGRAADYVLRDMDCVDVFISAPMEKRVAEIAHREGLSEKEATRKIEKVDRQRSDFYNFFTFTQWGVASNYDLCIDASILGIEGTADLICHYLEMI